MKVPSSGQDISNLYNLVGRDFAPGKIAADAVDDFDLVPAGVRFDVACHVVAQVTKGDDGNLKLLGAFVTDVDSFPLSAEETVMCGDAIVGNADISERVGTEAENLLAALFEQHSSNEVAALLDAIVDECSTRGHAS